MDEIFFDFKKFIEKKLKSPRPNDNSRRRSGAKSPLMRFFGSKAPLYDDDDDDEDATPKYEVDVSLFLSKFVSEFKLITQIN